MKSSFINYRRLWLPLVSFIIVSFAASANPGTEEVNSEVLHRFANRFAAAKNVTWKVTKEFSKASFTVNNRQTEVFYNRRNKLIATSVNITLQELPAGGVENIAHDYAKYTTTAAIQYTNAQGETACFVQLENDSHKIIVQVNEDGKLDYVRSERK